MKITTKQIAVTGLLLAICIISQYFKTISPYITGPIVNATLILAVLGSGLFSGILLSIIAPITAFFFTGSPLMAAVPLMFPVIMLGNLILVFCVYYSQSRTKSNKNLIAGLAVGSILKSIFLGGLVVLVILPLFHNALATKIPNPEKLAGFLTTIKMTFSVTQLITAVIGSVIAYLIWIPLKKVLNSE